MDHIYVFDTIRAAGMDETYGTYVDDECFDIDDDDDDHRHHADDDTDDNTDSQATLNQVKATRTQVKLI